MKDRQDDISANHPHQGSAGRQPLVVRVTDSDFQGEVLEKLGRLEAKMDMLVGSGQPGRVKLVEGRVTQLEKSEIRRGVYDRIVNAAITVAISVGHRHARSVVVQVTVGGLWRFERVSNFSS